MVDHDGVKALIRQIIDCDYNLTNLRGLLQSSFTLKFQLHPIN